ncbi:MAG: cytochrome P450 [Chitinophagales bacterium]|nr:MAG: cytochrome P450 [Chitinophagales bacterium]
MTTSTLPLPPAPAKEHWLLGSGYHLATDTIAFLQEQCPQFDGIMRITSRFEKVMIVYHPDYIRYVLQENNRNYVKSFGYEVLKMLLGEGLLTSEGEFWRRQRRLIQPAFSRERLYSVFSIMTDCVREWMDELEKKRHQGPVNMQKEMMALALHVVARALFSSDVKDLVAAVGENMDIANESAIDRIRDPFRPPPWFPSPMNIRERRAIKALNHIIMRIIHQRRRTTTERLDLMGMLMATADEETGERMSDRQLRDEAITIFLAGHETTALALTWLWYCLHAYPDIEAKVRQEARQVLAGKTPRVEHLTQLEYTRMVIEETLRLYPPAWTIGRKALTEDRLGEYLIPAGYNLLMPAFIVHRDPKWWDNPETFDPLRFEKDKVKTRPRFTYFPFGGGPRLCVGNNFAMMEMLLAVSMTIQEYSFRKTDNEHPGLDPLITLRPKWPVMMEVIKI